LKFAAARWRGFATAAAVARIGCRFLWFVSFGQAKEMNNNNLKNK